MKNKIIEALKAVKAPGARMSIIESEEIKGIDVQEKSALIQLILRDQSPLVEKSIRFQIEKGLSAIDPHLQVTIEFKKPDASSLPQIGTMIAVGSGKGGVGKSSVTANLAIAFQKMGYSVGILDCDIYGPSIPTMFHVEGKKPLMLNGKVQPIESHGIKLMSAGFFVESGQSIIWRGPMIHKLIQQFWGDVDWGPLDLLLVDLPPGTGDAPLSLSQVMPLTGAVMVSTPQHISLIDVQKGISMFNQVKVPILGVIENMSAFECPKCHHVEAIFDQGRVKDFCRELQLTFLGDIPIEPRIRLGGDQGEPFLLNGEHFPAGRALMKVSERLTPFVKRANEAEAPTRIIL